MNGNDSSFDSSHHGRSSFGPSNDPRMLYQQFVLLLICVLLIGGGVGLLLALADVGAKLLLNLGAGVVSIGVGLGGIILVNRLWRLWFAYAPTTDEEPAAKPTPRSLPSPGPIIRNWLDGLRASGGSAPGVVDGECRELPAVDLAQERARLQALRFSAFLRGCYSSRDLSFRHWKMVDLPGGRLSETEWRRFCTRLLASGVAHRPYERSECTLAVPHSIALVKLHTTDP